MKCMLLKKKMNSDEKEWCNILDEFKHGRLTLHTNTSLFSILCSHSHALWKIFLKVIHPKTTPSQAHLTVEFL